MRYNDEVINEHADIIKWSSVAQSPDLKYVSIDCLKKYECEFSNEDWEFISQNQCLSEDFIREFKDKVDWTLICENQTLSEDFINEFEDKVDWRVVSTYSNYFVDCNIKIHSTTLSEDFFRKNYDRLPLILLDSLFTISFLKEHAHKFNNYQWQWVSEKQILSEDFIREFKDKVYWTLICENQTLSEDFINEFEDKVDWSLISIYQRPFNKKFSIEFLKKNINKIDWGCYSVFHTLTTEEKKEFKKELKKIK